MSARAGGHHGAVLLRAGMALVALLVAAWLGLSLRNAVLTNRVFRLAIAASVPVRGGSASARQSFARAAIDDAKRARLLNPDRVAEIYATAALAVLGRRAEALHELDEIARVQPDNAYVWVAMASLSHGFDRAREARANARLAELAPVRR